MQQYEQKIFSNQQLKVTVGLHVKLQYFYFVFRLRSTLPWSRQICFSFGKLVHCERGTRNQTMNGWCFVFRLYDAMLLTTKCLINHQLCGYSVISDSQVHAEHRFNLVLIFMYDSYVQSDLPHAVENFNKNSLVLIFLQRLPLITQWINPKPSVKYYIQ